MSMNLKRLKGWSKEIFLWLSKAQQAILCTLFILLACLYSFYAYPGEQSIRISGYVLQVVGMVFTIRGLLRIRKHFGQPKLTSLSIEWLKRFPKWKREPISLEVADGVTVTAGLDARLEVWAPDKKEDTLEKRIDGIVRNQESLKIELRAASHEIKELRKNQKKHNIAQEKALDKMENQLRSDLESLHTDDIVISLVGLIWLVVGISMSTLSVELSKIFQ